MTFAYERIKLDGVIRAYASRYFFSVDMQCRIDPIEELRVIKRTCDTNPIIA
jgi:hypothetical protein